MNEYTVLSDCTVSDSQVHEAARVIAETGRPVYSQLAATIAQSAADQKSSVCSCPIVKAVQAAAAAAEHWFVGTHRAVGAGQHGAGKHCPACACLIGESGQDAAGLCCLACDHLPVTADHSVSPASHLGLAHQSVTACFRAVRREGSAGSWPQTGGLYEGKTEGSAESWPRIAVLVIGMAAAQVDSAEAQQGALHWPMVMICGGMRFVVQNGSNEAAACCAELPDCWAPAAVQPVGSECQHVGCLVLVHDAAAVSAAGGGDALPSEAGCGGHQCHPVHAFVGVWQAVQPACCVSASLQLAV